MTDKSQSSAQSRQQQQHDTGPSPTPNSGIPGIPELTAEWVVRAQLTFGRPGETVTRDFTTNNNTNTIRPVRVVYRWSSGEGAATEEEKPSPSSRETLGGSGQSTPLKKKGIHAESFNSANSGDFCGADSAFSGSNTPRNQNQQQQQQQKQQQQQLYGTRCRSTCNIIVSAVADFLPNAAGNDIPEEEPDPFVFNTTASYTVIPDQPPVNSSNVASKSFTSGKILALRDAFSQTSDTETTTKYLPNLHHTKTTNTNEFRYSSRSPPTDRRSTIDDFRRQQRRFYDHNRRATDTLLPPPPTSPTTGVDEGNSFTPSYTPSPTQTCKSASLPRIPPLPGHQRQQQQQQQQQTAAASSGPKSEPKKPRTVHIDVYCTGSDDDEDDNDDEDELDIDDSSSSSSDATNHLSNSTPQTVLDNEQMLLRHQRIGASTLPRRVNLNREKLSGRSPNPPTTVSSTSRSDLNVGHAITKSSTADEVSESKQLLFRKHIGDQRAAKLQNLRQKYIRKDPSDDCISSNYPNSSRSTMRDATCSSISSAMASQDQESSWKETEDTEASMGLAKSDSFDYDNSVDRLRIRQMESLWSRPEGEANFATTRSHTQPVFLHPISEGNSQRTSPYTGNVPVQRNDTLPSESENFSESDNVFYPYHRFSAPAQQQLYEPPPPPVSPSHRPKIVYSYPATPNRDPPAFMQFFGPRPQSPQTGFQPSFRPGLQRWKSEARDDLDSTALKPSQTFQRAGSETPSPTKALTPDLPHSPPVHLLPSPVPSPKPGSSQRESSVASSSVAAIIKGYTAEHLQKAQKFGQVMGTVRKPGHHVGPTKNPNCLCEHCQRWMAERFQIRSRAFSVGDKPVVLKRPNFNRN
ncbi:rho GTPase-activating protein gacU [Episyrphus balteatus]|uniref:rho GTPase-activating protein gacU n=1 Tax=Episyrphus balteatus TaxID=286459 RepID=UPI002485736C|nr:rho GTPase-activating protein gacU [Episyrphus balteatus]